jgi:hypothetical protein
MGKNWASGNAAGGQREFNLHSRAVEPIGGCAQPLLVVQGNAAGMSP